MCDRVEKESSSTPEAELTRGRVLYHYCKAGKKLSVVIGQQHAQPMRLKQRLVQVACFQRLVFILEQNKGDLGAAIISIFTHERRADDISRRPQEAVQFRQRRLLGNIRNIHHFVWIHHEKIER